jgi:hypothetical protein
MKIMLAAVTALSLFTGIQALHAEDTRLAYVEKSMGDSQVRKMWSDVAASAQPLGQYSPWALVATKDIGDGRSLTITQLWAGGICSATACPLRVYEGDELLASEMACSETPQHSISDDGRMIVACDAIFRTNRK